MIGIFGNPQVAVEVGGIFGSAAQDIRDRASSSLRAEEEGERGAREDSYTDEFIYQMRSRISHGLNDVARRLSNTGTKVEINFHTTNLPVSEENRYGADIGLRIIFRTYQAVLVKGLLIQCKRMYPPASKPSYQELRGRGESRQDTCSALLPPLFSCCLIMESNVIFWIWLPFRQELSVLWMGGTLFVHRNATK